MPWLFTCFLRHRNVIYIFRFRSWHSKYARQWKLCAEEITAIIWRCTKFRVSSRYECRAVCVSRPRCEEWRETSISHTHTCTHRRVSLSGIALSVFESTLSEYVVRRRLFGAKVAVLSARPITIYHRKWKGHTHERA